jgi:hypothetical protein
VMSVWLLFFLYWINIQISHFHIVPSRTWSEPNVEYLHYFNSSIYFQRPCLYLSAFMHHPDIFMQVWSWSFEGMYYDMALVEQRIVSKLVLCSNCCNSQKFCK